MHAIPNRRDHCHIRDLSFASSLVVWALRQGVHQPSDASALWQSFERTFGADGVHAAMSAFGRLIGSLRRGLRQAPDIRVPDDGAVSRQEAALLTVIASIQLGLGDEAQRLITRMIFEDEREEFMSVTTVFAKSLASVGQVLPPDGREDGPVVPLSSWSKPRPKPRDKGLDWLTAQEALIVTGVRVWARALKQGGTPHAVLHAHFEEWGVAEATSSLNAILNHTGRCATRPFDVRCPNCPGLSADEARILGAIEAMHRADGVAAMGALLAWLPPQVARLTLVPLEGLARIFTDVRAELPRRHWRFEAMERSDGAHPHRSDETRPTLH